MTDITPSQVVAGGVRWRDHDHKPRPCCIDAILSALSERYHLVSKDSPLEALVRAGVLTEHQTVGTYDCGAQGCAERGSAHGHRTFIAPTRETP